VHEHAAVLTADRAGYIVLEMIARFCDHNGNDNRCQRRATQIRNSQVTSLTRADDGTLTITITYPDISDDAAADGGSSQPTQSRGNLYRGLVATTDADLNAELYVDAASDDDSGSGYTVNDDNSGASPRVTAGVGAAISAVFIAAAASFATRRVF